MSKKDEEKNTPETESDQTAAPAAEETPAQEAAPEKSETELLQAKLDEANDKYLRMLAEYDNYRRRSQKERENIYADVRADTVKKLLPVYDNLARAAAQEPTEDARKGMEAILTQFKTILTGLGVTEIEAVGQKFDPSLHEALLHVEDEKYGEGEIVLELEKGFKLGDKVIRFSKVQVAN
jgi:molecular chaperone GrpE